MKHLLSLSSLQAKGFCCTKKSLEHPGRYNYSKLELPVSADVWENGRPTTAHSGVWRAEGNIHFCSFGFYFAPQTHWKNCRLMQTMSQWKKWATAMWRKWMHMFEMHRFAGTSAEPYVRLLRRALLLLLLLFYNSLLCLLHLGKMRGK